MLNIKGSSQSNKIIIIRSSKLTFSTNLFHQSASTHLDCLLRLYWTGILCSMVFHF